MKSIKIIGLISFAYFITVQQVFAGEPPDALPELPGLPVPEIDGGSAIIAIGLVAGLVALVREKFFRK